MIYSHVPKSASDLALMILLQKVVCFVIGYVVSSIQSLQKGTACTAFEHVQACILGSFGGLIMVHKDMCIVQI